MVKRFGENVLLEGNFVTLYMEAHKLWKIVQLPRKYTFHSSLNGDDIPMLKFISFIFRHHS